MFVLDATSCYEGWWFSLYTPFLPAIKLPATPHLKKKGENADKHQLSEREKLGGLVVPIKYVWFLKVSSLYYTSNIFDLTIFCHSH